jgi:hypothetical protein
MDGIPRGRRSGIYREHHFFALVDEIADGRLERFEHALRESCSDRPRHRFFSRDGWEYLRQVSAFQTVVRN